MAGSNSPEEIKKYISLEFKKLGLNKKREISRLVYEISKRDRTDFKKIISDLKGCSFSKLKMELLKRRYPDTVFHSEKINPYLPELTISEENKMCIHEKEIYPENIYFDKDSNGSDLLEKLKKKFPNSEFSEILSIKDYNRDKKYSIKTYNSRRKNVFVINENFDFFRKCPCTKGCVCCNYYIFNFGFGCPYECTYCYLQEYTNTPGLVVPSNLEQYFESFGKYTKKFKRIGTGEFADSLALENITEFAPVIIEFFRKYPDIMFEFKTKSANVDTIIKTETSENIVIAWSLNPQKFIEKNEFYSANLSGRIAAAKKCADAGYKVAFHFDPIVYYEGWQRDYKEVVELIFDNIKGENIKWISLGTFRFTRNLKKIIENRFPENDILDGELILGFDGKLRYTDSIRVKIYCDMIRWISDKSSYPYIYLCMESLRTWKACGLTSHWRWS